MTKKGQSSIEFVILVSFVMLFIISFLAILGNRLNEDKKTAYDKETYAIATTVQNEFLLAFQSQDGYSRTFTLPSHVLSTNYTIQLVAGSVYVLTDDESHAVSLPVVNASGSIQKGSNTIRKLNGTLILN